MKYSLIIQKLTFDKNYEQKIKNKVSKHPLHECQHILNFLTDKCSGVNLKTTGGASAKPVAFGTRKLGGDGRTERLSRASGRVVPPTSPTTTANGGRRREALDRESRALHASAARGRTRRRETACCLWRRLLAHIWR